MPQSIRAGGTLMASQGRRGMEFELNLERSLDVQKLRGERVQFNSNGVHFVGMQMASYGQGPEHLSHGGSRMGQTNQNRGCGDEGDTGPVQAGPQERKWKLTPNHPAGTGQRGNSNSDPLTTLESLCFHPL